MQLHGAFPGDGQRGFLVAAMRGGWPADARIEPARLGQQVAALRAAVAALA